MESSGGSMVVWQSLVVVAWSCLNSGGGSMDVL